MLSVGKMQKPCVFYSCLRALHNSHIFYEIMVRDTAKASGLFFSVPT